MVQLFPANISIPSVCPAERIFAEKQAVTAAGFTLGLLFLPERICSVLGSSVLGDGSQQ
jgi:hypothetical protein